MSDQIATTLSELATLQRQTDLSLLKLGEPLLSAAANPTSPAHRTAQRSSDASSTDSSSHPTAASLQSDLAHYRDLFTKLRFSYTSQVTKEKFLRALVADPPALTEPEENAELESTLADLKASLQAQKAAVDATLQQLEAQARSLARRWQAVQERGAQLGALPAEVERLSGEVGVMREQLGDEGGEGDMGLGLEATVNLVEEREGRLEVLDRRLEDLAEQRHGKERELARLKEEVRRAERDKENMIGSAEEARRRRRDGRGGVGDEVEERGRWLQGVETTLRGLLEVEA